MIWRGYSALACLLLVAACSQETGEVAVDDSQETAEIGVDNDVEDRTPYEETKLAADTAEGYERGAVPAPVTPVQGPEGAANATVTGPLTVTGNLQPLSREAPVPGTITITEAGAGTTVLVKIDRYTPGTTLVATLTEGRCPETGEIVTRIGEPFTVGQQGFATLEANVGVSTRAILDGRHSVRINTPGRGAPEMVLACANLPAAP